MKHDPNKVISASARGIVIFVPKKKPHGIAYAGDSVRDIQLRGKRRQGQSYQAAPVYRPFNPTQKQLYNRLLYGLEGLSRTELERLSPTERETIQSRYRQAQGVINRLKNRVLAQQVDRRIAHWFKASALAQELLTMGREMVDEFNDLSLRELGITQHQLAQWLIEHGLLPVTFFDPSYEKA